MATNDRSRPLAAAPEVGWAHEDPALLTPWGALFCPACPAGNARLIFDRPWLSCTAGHHFPVRDGIPLLMPEEAARWAHKNKPNTPNERAVALLALTVVIPALNEGENLALLLPGLVRVLDGMAIAYEILVVTKPGDPTLADLAPSLRKQVADVRQSEPGYGGAVRAGIAAARGRYTLTMDADLSHSPDFLTALWGARRRAEIVIASRYIKGGSASMPPIRYLLSRVLNVVFRRGLSLKVRDMSSGFRVMRTDAIQRLQLHGTDFDIVQEVLVGAHAQGWRIAEVPFHYAPRHAGRSHARVFGFGAAYLRTFGSLWKLRNSILSADYDARAYDSIVPLQRYWQRSRFNHITELIAGEGPVLDVGCGSSRIIGALPKGSIALDILLHKLRHNRRYGVPQVHGSGFALPYGDGSFPCVLSSEVIEHVPKDSPIIDELCRVVAPGGRLVIGTPDYNSRLWVALETVYAKVAPGGYADEHIAHYTRPELIDLIESRGFAFEDERDILGAEIMLAFRRLPVQ